MEQKLGKFDMKFNLVSKSAITDCNILRVMFLEALQVFRQNVTSVYNCNRVYCSWLGYFLSILCY